MLKTLAFASLLVITPLVANTSSTEEELMAYVQQIFKTPGGISFTPPSSWGFTPPDPNRPTIKLTAIRQAGLSYPAMIYLGIHPYKGTLKGYLHTIETMEQAQGGVWKNLGTIETELGQASFSQVDYTANFGAMRHLLVLKVENGEAYLLTAAAKKEDFPKLYEEIFTSLKTLRKNPS